MKEMKRIYLASPYSGTAAEREERTRLVRLATAALLVAGVCVYSPISHAHELPLPPAVAARDEFWRPLNECEIARSDELWALELDGWERSRGMAREIEFARTRGISVRFVRPENEALGLALSRMMRGGEGAR